MGMQTVQSKLKNAFPSYLSEDIESIYNKHPLKNSLDHDAGTFTVIINNESIKIPARVYLEKIEHADYTPTQQCILDCYYTRHCDGFIREEYLKRIITHNREWIVPYVVQLLGEYVIEILFVIYNEINNLDIKLYKQFIIENKKFYDLTKQHVASYWNCYYRWEYKYKEDYVGFKEFSNMK